MLKQLFFSVLVVSDKVKFLDSIKGYLKKPLFEHTVAGSIGEAMRLHNQQFYDIVIIDAPLCDDPGLEFAKNLAVDSGSSVLVTLADPAYSDLRQILMELGICTLQRPTSPRAIYQVIDDLCALRSRLKKYEKQVVSVESKMLEIRHVNQAKLLLMEHKGHSESQAHHYIEKQAMNCHVNKDVIALQVIAKYS